MRVLLFASAVAALALGGGTAHASWYQASSKHFIIYADDNPKSLRNFAGWLERFDAALRVADHLVDPEVGDGNRLTVFVLPKAADVQALAGDKTGFLDGFYTGRISGPLAYIAKDAGTYGGLSDQTVFFHEYTHHLMMQDVSEPYPEWYVEGFAEFFSTPKFDKDGSVWFGIPAQHRAWGLYNGPKVPVETLFAGMPPNMPKEQRDVFYGRAWLLTHYLLMGGKREGQLASYLKLLSSGVASPEAARQTFGDFKQLDRELDSYMGNSMFAFKIAGARLTSVPIDVTPLSAGAAQVIIARSKIKYRLDQPAEALAAQVRAVESSFPGDELVERTLAEAELNAGHPEAAEAAADRALAADPKSTEAMVLKGRALADRGENSPDEAKSNALFEEARSSLIAANKLDTEDPEPLYEFYQTYPKEHIRPNANALAALHYASDLAPQDLGVRMSSAVAFLNEGKTADARSALTVVAYSPHAKDMGDMAKRMIGDLDAGNPKAALLELRSQPGAVAVKSR